MEASTAATTIPFTLQGAVPYAQSDLDAIAAVDKVTDVAFDPAGPANQWITGNVPKDSAKQVITSVARLYPNTPIRWSSTDAQR